MRIVDLRSPLERRIAEVGEVSARPWHAPAAWVADRLVAGRVARRGAPPDDLLVISVGNLRVGGTGKTPVVSRLARDLDDLGLCGGVVTRGYRAPDSTPRLVTADDDGAGDEARLLADHLSGTDWRVAQARDRRQGLELLREAVPRLRAAILEDAHQTAHMGRHIDVLILDRWLQRGTELVPQAGPVLPFGPYRESVCGARRAGIWLVEAEELPPGCAGPEGQTVVAFRRVMTVPDLGQGSRLGLISGLARPEAFEAGSVARLPTEPPVAVRFSDHADYDAAVRQQLADLTHEHQLDGWLTTGKDHVKLAPHWTLDQPLNVVELEVHWSTTPTLPELIEERRRYLQG